MDAGAVRYRPLPTGSVLECTDPSEWDALSKKDKEIYALLISAGIIDLGAETQSLSLLYAMFPEGTVTHIKLASLVA